MKNFVLWSFAIDESTVGYIYKRSGQGVNETEELLSLQCMKDTTTGANIFSEVFNAFNKFWFGPIHFMRNRN